MMILKICNENRGAFPALTFGDVANQQHAFQWNDKVGAYCYQPRNQQESDDIIASNWVFLKCPWRVAPVWDGSGQPAGSANGFTPAPVSASKFTIPPYVKPELYEAYPLRDLMDLCADAGFTPEGDVAAPENVRRQLHRYYEGRAWAAEEIRRLREKLAALESPTVEAATLPPAPAPIIAPQPEVPVAKKRGRPPKVRELQPA